jgi:hypothetical protein
MLSNRGAHKVRNQKTRDLYSAAVLAFTIFTIGLGLGLAIMSSVDIALEKHFERLFVLGWTALEDPCPWGVPRTKLRVPIGIKHQEAPSAHWHEQPGARLFHFTFGKFETTLKRATIALNLQSLQLVPHLLQHGGPSTDVYLGLRTLAGVHRRGFWKSADSVRRYEKPSKLLSQLNKLTVAQQHAVQAAAGSVPELLLQQL